MTTDVRVVSFDKRFRALEAELTGAAKLLLGKLGKQNTRLDIYLIGTRRMARLHRELLGKRGATNVLSLAVPDFPTPTSLPKPLGEVYLCPPYIREHGEDISHLLIHGILHILGFNHENKSDRMRMQQMEESLRQWLRRKYSA